MRRTYTINMALLTELNVVPFVLTLFGGELA